MLFNPENPRTETLGRNKLDFMSPRVFGPLRNVNDTASCGDVGQVAPQSSATIGATPNAGVGVAGTVLFAMVNPVDTRPA